MDGEDRRRGRAPAELRRGGEDRRLRHRPVLRGGPAGARRDPRQRRGGQRRHGQRTHHPQRAAAPAGAGRGCRARRDLSAAGRLRAPQRRRRGALRQPAQLRRRRGAARKEPRRGGHSAAAGGLRGHVCQRPARRPRRGDGPAAGLGFSGQRQQPAAGAGGAAGTGAGAPSGVERGAGGGAAGGAAGRRRAARGARLRDRRPGDQGQRAGGARRPGGNRTSPALGAGVQVRRAAGGDRGTGDQRPGGAHRAHHAGRARRAGGDRRHHGGQRHAAQPGLRGHPGARGRRSGGGVEAGRRDSGGGAGAGQERAGQHHLAPAGALSGMRRRAGVERSASLLPQPALPRAGARAHPLLRRARADGHRPSRNGNPRPTDRRRSAGGRGRHIHLRRGRLAGMGRVRTPQGRPAEGGDRTQPAAAVPHGAAGAGHAGNRPQGNRVADRRRLLRHRPLAAGRRARRPRTAHRH